MLAASLGLRWSWLVAWCCGVCAVMVCGCGGVGWFGFGVAVDGWALVVWWLAWFGPVWRRYGFDDVGGWTTGLGDHWGVGLAYFGLAYFVAMV